MEPRRIGCVSFLNSKPLIDGLEDLPDPVVKFDVPSRLLEDLETGEVDVALCPVIDYQRSAAELEIVPAGCIGCRGITLTVRLFSAVPLGEITRVHADVHSHTSVALMQVLLRCRFGRGPEVVPYQAGQHVDFATLDPRPEAMLLIGDKVVTDSPPAVLYPHQWDLGQGWLDMTSMPFVFATWMARVGTELGEVPELLQRTRESNQSRLDQIVARHAAAHGWPADLARQYLGGWMRYEMGPEQVSAAQRFWSLAHQQGLIERLRPLKIRG